MFSRPSRRRTLQTAGVVALAAVLAGVGVTIPQLRSHHVTLTLSGLHDGALLDAARVKTAALVVAPTGIEPASVTARIDGRAVPVGSRGSDRIVPTAGLSDGTHQLQVQANGVHGGTATDTLRVSVDTAPPVVQVAVPARRFAITDPVTVTGSLDAAADTVRAPGGTVRRDGTSFTVAYPVPPTGAVITVADDAGNTATTSVTVPTTYPDAIRGVHMTGAAWAYAPLRSPVLAMIAQHRINAVQLDIKDETGVVNFDAPVPLARADGAIHAYFDATAVAERLHAMGVRLIAREVAFNDTKLADYAWAHGDRDWVIQNPDGTPYSYGYAKSHFSNFADPNVVAYDIAIAKAAVRDGFDDVIFDYIRRPDGPIAKERFPGLPTGARAEPAAERAIAAFAQRAQAALRPLGGSVGAAIFAQAAHRPQDTAQNVPLMARHLDLVVPMDYPSHWNPGEYGVPDPYADPAAIVGRSLKDWQRAVAGTSCVVVPWLQDENYRGDYTAAKVQQEIRGATDDGLPGWLMWSAGATYTPAAFPPDAPRVYVPRPVVP